MRVRAHANKTGHKCRFFYVNSFSYLSPILACSYESEAQNLELRRDNFFCFTLKQRQAKRHDFSRLILPIRAPIRAASPNLFRLAPSFNPTQQDANQSIDFFPIEWLITSQLHFYSRFPPMNYLCVLLEQSLYIGRQFWSVLSYFVYQWQYFTTFCARDQI